MSKFNVFAKKLDEQARASFKAYLDAESAFKEAEQAAKDYPQRSGVSSEYQAKAARAQADLIVSKQKYDEARRTFRESDRQFNNLRRDLEAAVSDAYAADPGQLDANTLELLKSGILRADEYSRLIEKAKAEGNATMVRMIGRYVEQAADTRGKKYGTIDKEAAALRAAGYQCKAYTGADQLDTFDALESVYRRCTNNPALISSWDNLTAEAVENF